MQLVLESCTKERCRECDLELVIKDHIKAIIQIMSNILEEYYMKLITTKCLNTAVTMMYLFLGERATKYTSMCDVDNVIQAYSEVSPHKPDHYLIRNAIFADLKRKLFLRHSRYRYVYYIMLTDGDMYSQTDNRTTYFPGHVFVIEKCPAQTREEEPYFKIYQSYIQQYDLSGMIDLNKGRTTFSFQKIKKMFHTFDYFLNQKIWDDRCISFWKELTHVDVSDYKGFSTDNILLCYQAVKVTNCIEVLKKIVKKEKQSILKILKKGKINENDVYGDPSKYDSWNGKPLTNKQVLSHLDAISAKIAGH